MYDMNECMCTCLVHVGMWQFVANPTWPSQGPESEVLADVTFHPSYHKLCGCTSGRGSDACLGNWKASMFYYTLLQSWHLATFCRISLRYFSCIIHLSTAGTLPRINIFRSIRLDAGGWLSSEAVELFLRDLAILMRWLHGQSGQAKITFNCSGEVLMKAVELKILRPEATWDEVCWMRCWFAVR